jgi:1,4-alpha-glucan branching enzyme
VVCRQGRNAGDVSIANLTLRPEIVWELFLPDVGDGALYKFEVIRADGSVGLKADPMGFGSQHPP